MHAALHEVTWSMVVWCTQNALRRQQFHVAPAMLALYIYHFGGYLKMCYKKLVTDVESHASAVSLLESREQRYIKAINKTRLAQEGIQSIQSNHDLKLLINTTYQTHLPF